MMTEAAAAPPESPLSSRPNTYTDTTSVLNGRFPEMSTTAPNSPSARANASTTPERIAGRMLGRMIRRNVCTRPAPSDAAASSISRSSSKHKTETNAFLKFLRTEPAQKIFAQNGYRPVVKSAASGFNFSSRPQLFTINYVGGWAKVEKKFFDPKTGIMARVIGSSGG